MHISLTPELESIVRRKVESGLYNNASEVVREALRFMEINFDSINEMKLEAIRQILAVGEAQIARGEGVLLADDAAIDHFFAELGQDEPA